METLVLLHDQDAQHVSGLNVPASVVSAAKAAAVAATARAQPRPAPDDARSSEQPTLPTMPIARPPRHPAQPAASVALSQSRPKQARKAGWVAQSLVEATVQADTHVHKRKKVHSAAGRELDHRAGQSGSAGVPTQAQSLQKGSCCAWEDFDEHEPVVNDPAEAHFMSSRMIDTRAERYAASTQPNEVLASRREPCLVTDAELHIASRPTSSHVEEEVDSAP